MTSFVDLKTVDVGVVDDFSVDPTPKFPATRGDVAALLGKSDMTVGRWIKSFAEAGVNCVDSRNRIPQEGYAHLLKVKLKIDAGEQAGDAIAAVAAELMPSRTSVPMNQESDGVAALETQYTALTVSRRLALASRTQLAERQAEDAMQALQTLVNIRQTEAELEALDQEALEKKWRAEAARQLLHEQQFKLSVRAELKEKLGLY